MATGPKMIRWRVLIQSGGAVEVGPISSWITSWKSCICQEPLCAAVSQLPVTYVGVSHQQGGLGVAGLQLDQLLQTGRGHPAHPLPTKGQGLWLRCFCHQLWTERHLYGVNVSLKSRRRLVTARGVQELLCESM